MHRLATLSYLLVTLAVCSSVLAAGMTGHTLKQQKTVGMYRLVLQIGPAEKMSMSRKGGEKMMSGKTAMCQMAGGGMHMTVSAPELAGMHTCNRHVELHVYNARTHSVLMHARVSIMLRDVARRMTIMVPIMTMMDPKMGMKDFHYGNNIYAAPGPYSVLVTVNGTHATFKVHLL